MPMRCCVFHHTHATHTHNIIIIEFHRKLFIRPGLIAFNVSSPCVWNTQTLIILPIFVFNVIKMLHQRVEIIK